jgi:hypothetical protein
MYGIDGWNSIGSFEVAGMCWLGDRPVARSAKAIIEVECAERVAKTARLKSLRMAQILLEADPCVSFNEELDCSVLVAVLARETKRPRPESSVGHHRLLDPGTTIPFFPSKSNDWKSALESTCRNR